MSKTKENAATGEWHGEFARGTELVHVALTWYAPGEPPADRVQIGPDGAVVDVSFVRYAKAAH
jgi:hypothetical protein